MWAPKLSGREALRVAGEHFLDCIRHGKTPDTDGGLGLRVVELIEAATNSMRGKGEAVYVKRLPGDRRRSRVPRRSSDYGLCADLKVEEPEVAERSKGKSS